MQPSESQQDRRVQPIFDLLLAIQLVLLLFRTVSALCLDAYLVVSRAVLARSSFAGAEREDSHRVVVGPRWVASTCASSLELCGHHGAPRSLSRPYKAFVAPTWAAGSGWRRQEERWPSVGPRRGARHTSGWKVPPVQSKVVKTILTLSSYPRRSRCAFCREPYWMVGDPSVFC